MKRAGNRRAALIVFDDEALLGRYGVDPARALRRMTAVQAPGGRKTARPAPVEERIKAFAT